MELLKVKAIMVVIIIMQVIELVIIELVIRQVGVVLAMATEVLISMKNLNKFNYFGINHDH